MVYSFTNNYIIWLAVLSYLRHSLIPRHEQKGGQECNGETRFSGGLLQGEATAQQPVDTNVRKTLLTAGWFP
jgi:hypothetical protein